jgi:dTDP-4-amino-4,6-dideoxygalactose transaminase
LSDFPLVLPWQHPDTESSWHLYVIRLKLDEIGKTHRQVFEELRAAKIGVNLHYIPVHTQPYYQNLGFKWGDFPQAEQYYQEAISLPIYYGLSDENQDQVGAVLRNILSEK